MKIVSISGISYFLAHQKEYDFMKTFERTKRLIFWAFMITIITYILISLLTKTFKYSDIKLKY